MPRDLARQHRGGLANFRGGVFEEMFGVYRTLLAVESLLTGNKTRLALQLRNAPVDDWVEARGSERHHFQLKRSRSTSWAAVAEEFRAQLQSGGNRTVTLVVSSTNRARRLLRSRRREAAWRVIHFSGATKPRHQWRRGPVANVVERLCLRAVPTDSEREAIWSAIKTAWENVRKPGAFVDVAAVIEALPDRQIPIATPWNTDRRTERAMKILHAIEGMKVAIERGHFLYWFRDGIEGSISCRTSDFRKFVTEVLQQHPVQLDDVRGLL